MSLPTITIAGRPIGPGHPCYVIAEVSANHNQDFEKAKQLVRVAAEAGADAVKLQTYTADTITHDIQNEHFLIKGGTLWDGKYLHELYREAYTPWEWQPELRKLALSLGIELFSSPFDATAVDFLERMDVPAYKVASPELIDLPLIRKIAETGKPVIMSTGMATLGEIDEAMRTARDAGLQEIALLKTNSAYPAPPGEMHIRTIEHLSAAFGVPAGLSDHTLGYAVAVAAVALGATIVEKHFCLTRDEPGPDSAFSMEPQELADMVTSIRQAEAAIGTVRYEITEKQIANRAYRKSLFVVEDVAAGEPFTNKNVRCIRPGSGLHPRYQEQVIGARATRPIARGTPLAWDLVMQAD